MKNNIISQELKDKITAFVNSTQQGKRTLLQRLMIECSERWAMNDFIGIIKAEGHKYTISEQAEGFGYAWEMTEFLYTHKSSLKLLLKLYSGVKHKFMGDRDYEVYKKLPNKIRIYRGGSDKDGLSWTLSKEKAEWFAERNKFYTGVEQQVFTKVVHKNRVFAYLNNRKEQEIILY